MGGVSDERERKIAGGESKGRERVAVVEKMRKRNFVVFACVCEKNLVPLHAFRVCACKRNDSMRMRNAAKAIQKRTKAVQRTQNITNMIDYIKGELTFLTPTYAVIEAAGVGYQINIALTSYSALSAYPQPLQKGKGGLEQEETRGAICKLFVTEIIREDTHDLFGFFTTGERELFVMLMTVSGIGANTARMIMSAYTAAEIRQIIATGNARALSQVKGLGPKTAQRVIVDLKDKVLKIDLGSDVQGQLGDEAIRLSGDEAMAVDNEVKQEAVSALTMLGFAAAASGKVVDKILKEEPSASVEKVIKLALKML